MNTKILLPMIVLLTVAVANVNGQTMRQNSRHERARIADGRRDGELTKGESFRLAREQRHIRKERRHARRDDGHIDRNERRKIRHDQRKASRHIYRAKHNNRKPV